MQNVLETIPLSVAGAVPPLGEFTANDQPLPFPVSPQGSEHTRLDEGIAGGSAMPPLQQEQVPQQGEGSGAAEPGPNRQVGHSVLSEMSAAHPAVDAAMISVKGLKKCPYFSRQYEADPEQAQANAEKMVQKVRVVEEMRAEGKTDAEIRVKFLADELARYEAMEEPAKRENPEPEPAKTNQVKRTERQATAVETTEGAQPVPGGTPERVEHVGAASEPASLPSETVQPPVPDKRTQDTPTTREVPATHEEAGQAVSVRPRAEQAYVATHEAAVLGAVTYALAAGHVPPYDTRRQAVIAEAEITITPQEPSSSSRTGTDASAEATLNQEASYEGIQDEQLPFAASGEGLPPSLALQSPGIGLNEGAIGGSDTMVWPQQELLERDAPVEAAAGLGPAVGNDALEKEPLEFYDEFVQALDMLAGVAEALPGEESIAEMAGEASPLPSVAKLPTVELETETRPDPGPEPVPPIAVTVIERLQELEPAGKETVAPVLQHMVAAARAVAVRQAEGAEPEVIEAATARLEEQIVALFDYLEVPYKPEDAERFASVLLQLLRPALQSVSADDTEAAADREHDGTREARLHAPVAQLAGALSDVEERIERLLGRVILTLSHTTRGSRRGYELAA